ncbi:MAG: hypothetical protein LBC74_11960 [Planctomycetaceae bacterium]|nr:hypothetical protein [Planctomycetaceae bacterium]
MAKKIMKRNVFTQKNLIVLLLVLCFITSGAEQIFAQVKGESVTFINKGKQECKVAIAGVHRNLNRLGLRQDLDPKPLPDWYEQSVSGWYTIKPGESRTLECGNMAFYCAFSDRKAKSQQYYWVYPQDRFLMKERSYKIKKSLIAGEPVIYDSVYWGDPHVGKDYSRNMNYSNSLPYLRANVEELEKNGWIRYPFVKCSIETKKIILEDGTIKIDTLIV